MKRKLIIIISIVVAVVISVCAIGYFGNHFFEFFYEDTPENAIVYDDIYDKYVVYYHNGGYKTRCSVKYV